MDQVNGVYVQPMLTYKQAIKILSRYSFRLKPRCFALGDSLGLILARDVFAPEPFPAFDNSAVDGYAIRFPSPSRGVEKIRLKVTGEIRAGECFPKTIKAGEAIRIFTGAPVPKGAQAVVMQEFAERMNGSVLLQLWPRPKEHIRFRGEDFQKGKLLIRKGTLLEPTHLALLQALGCEKVLVYPAPAVSIFATGSELLRAGEPIAPGKIRDSNTILIEAMVKKLGGIPRRLQSVRDDPKEIRAVLRQGLASDLLLISGGVSVGKYDFVKDALKKEGVREIFWKVNIKPGKPLFFGKKGKTLVFGLPGNPVSVFVTFEEFVKPILLRMMAREQSKSEPIQGRLQDGFRNGSRMNFVRVRCVPRKNGYAVFPFKGQGSHRIGELASANGLMKVDPHKVLKKNQLVQVTIIGRGE